MTVFGPSFQFSMSRFWIIIIYFYYLIKNSISGKTFHFTCHEKNHDNNYALKLQVDTGKVENTKKGTITHKLWSLFCEFKLRYVNFHLAPITHPPQLFYQEGKDVLRNGDFLPVLMKTLIQLITLIATKQIWQTGVKLNHFDSRLSYLFCGNQRN